MSVREIRGELPWGLEPVSTGSFAGVALRDVLLAAGPTEGAAHVGFVGLDEVVRKQRTVGFGGSIPLAKALSSDVLLAFGMNGEPLPAIHGGPVRVVVPGYIGARSVKWLGEVEVRAEPSENYFQAEAYRLQREVRGGDARDVTAGEALAEVPLNAVILSPKAGSTRTSGAIAVSGWACGTGCRRPARVEVSGDGGATWTRATLEDPTGEWTWVRWSASVEVTPGPGSLIARAWDLDGTGQPETLAEVWNVKGYANNAWHRVPIEVQG
jgi:sulfite oxidase